MVPQFPWSHFLSLDHAYSLLKWVNRAGLPLPVSLGVFLILTFILYRKKSGEIVSRDEPRNPAQLKPAILFGLLYAVILFVVAATLSTAQMMNKGGVVAFLGDSALLKRIAVLYGIAIVSGIGIIFLWP